MGGQLIPSPTEHEINRRLTLFGNLTHLQKDKICEAALANDMRGVGSLANTQSANIRASIIDSISLARKRNICPIMHYGFHGWLAKPGDKHAANLTYRLADAATHYLYRLVLLENLPSEGIALGNGAYAHTKLIKRNGRYLVRKQAKNLASQEFAMAEEVETFYALHKTRTLNGRIPKLNSWNEEASVIDRQYIKGSTGHEILENASLSMRMKEDLEDIFVQLINAEKSLDINLDLHPANFVWSTNSQKWILIDLGRTPMIAKSYFPRDSFKKYYRKIWNERLFRMRNMPVRSFYLPMHNDTAHFQLITK